MKRFFDHYRRFGKNVDRVFLAMPETAHEAWNFASEQAMREAADKSDKDKLKADLSARFGPAAYAAMLGRVVQGSAGTAGLFPEGSEAIGRDFIRQKTAEYKEKFKTIEQAFADAVADLEAARNEAIDTVIAHTQADLTVLRKRVGAAKSVETTKNEIPREIPPFSVEPWYIIASPESVEYKEMEEHIHWKVQEYLGKKLELLMDEDLYDSDDGEMLRAGICLQAADRIAALFAEGKASKETLEKLVTKIENELKKMAGLDGNPGDLSVKDAAKLKLAAGAIPEQNRRLSEVMESENADEIMRALEARRVLSPAEGQAWRESVVLMAEETIAEVEHSGNQNRFTETMRKTAKPLDIPDFESAKDYFLETMKNKAKSGVRETVQTFHRLKSNFNASLIGVLSDVEDGMKDLAYGERQRLMDGLSAPATEWDRAVVNFMRLKTPAERAYFLEDENRRELLFTGIKIARDEEVGYAKYYNDAAAPNLTGKKPEDLRTGYDRQHPTTHDHWARIKALIMLAGEAEWIAENFGYKKELSAMETPGSDSGTVYQPDTRFKDVTDRVELRYESAASRAGVNGKDGLLTLGKIWGGALAVVNLLNSYKNGEDWEARIDAALHNPFIYAGAAAFKGVEWFRRDPRVAGIPKAGPGLRAEIMTHAALYSLARKCGQTELRKYISMESEWELMKKLESGAAKKLVEAAREKDPEHLLITKELIAEHAPGLPEDLMNRIDENMSYERFYFFSKFLQSKVNLPQLQNECERW